MHVASLDETYRGIVPDAMLTILLVRRQARFQSTQTMQCGYRHVSRFTVECFPALAVGADVSQQMRAPHTVPSPRQRMGYVA